MIRYFIMFKRGLCVVLLVISVFSRLFQVASVFRHGARYPLHNVYDANATKEFWGELTAVGMRQHQTLGEMLRKDYIDKGGFLSVTYKQSQINVYTTNVNRTYQSVLSQLYGLYPLGQGPLLPQTETLYHLPPYKNITDRAKEQSALPQAHSTIPVYINLTASMIECPRAAQEMSNNEQLQIDVYHAMNGTYFGFMQQMGHLFNFTTLNFSAMINLYDTLAVDKNLGRPLPSQLDQKDYLNLQHLTNWYSYFRLTNDLAKAFNTLPLKRIIADFDDRINNLESKPLKWTFFSSHDTNLFCLTASLNISSAHCIEQLYSTGHSSALNCEPGPEFAASVIFELHQEEEEFLVRIRYNGKYVYLCERKQTKCAYQEWKSRIIQNVLIDNVRQICFGSNQQTVQTQSFDVSQLA